MIRRSLLSLAAIPLLYGCHAKDDHASPLPVAYVEVVHPAVADGGAALSLPITLRRDVEAKLAFRVGGTITAMPVRIGQRVEAGALISAIDATPYAAARQRAAAEVERLERTSARYAVLAGAGAIAEADRRDTGTALAAARAALAAAIYDERSARLTAPFSGVVLDRAAEVGEVATPGQLVVSLADLRAPLIGRVAAPSSIAARLHIGGVAKVSLPDGRAVVSHVLRIGGASDTRSGTTDIDLSLPADAGASGTIGSVRFDEVKTPGTIAGAAPTLPAEALVAVREGRAELFIHDRRRGVARRIYARFLGFDGESLRVSGLPAGAEVITSGAGFVLDGQRVRVIGR